MTRTRRKSCQKHHRIWEPISTNKATREGERMGDQICTSWFVHLFLLGFGWFGTCGSLKKAFCCYKNFPLYCFGFKGNRADFAQQKETMKQMECNPLFQGRKIIEKRESSFLLGWAFFSSRSNICVSNAFGDRERGERREEERLLLYVT